MGDMSCETCKYWKKKPHPKTEWGDCRLLGSGDSDKCDFYCNLRDGEWVECHVETLPDFFCAQYEKGGEDENQEHY